MRINTKSVGQVLGIISLLTALFLTIPLLIAHLYNEAVKPFAFSAALALFMSIPYFFFRGQAVKLSIKDSYIVVTFGWIIIAFIGAFPFYFSGHFGNFANCFFESMSGFTTTGASILTDIEAVPGSLLFWRSFTHWVGGMGIILFSIAILPMLGIGGMQMFKAEVPGPTSEKITPRIKQTAKILWLVYAGMTALQTALLMFGGMSLLDALCHTFGTVATGGFSTKNASVAGYNSAYIEWVIIVFMVLAGINFSLHFHLLTGKMKAVYKNPELRFYLAVLMVATIFILLQLPTTIGSGFEEKLRISAFQVVSITTTTGFATADYELWAPFGMLMLLLLMFFGGSAGSTGGGMKQIRILIMFKYLRRSLHKIFHPNVVWLVNVGRKKLEKNILTNVVEFILFFFISFAFIALLLTALGVDILTSISASAATLGNIGPGLGSIGPTENYAHLPDTVKWVLSFAMLLGRLEIFTVMVIFSRHFWKR